MEAKEQNKQQKQAAAHCAYCLLKAKLASYNNEELRTLNSSCSNQCKSNYNNNCCWWRWWWRWRWRWQWCLLASVFDLLGLPHNLRQLLWVV